MTKLKFLFISCLVVTIGINQSCNPEENFKVTPKSSESTIEEKYNLYSSFAKILAPAMKNTGLRKLLRAEALKQFDKDYDILYHMIKYQEVDGTTVHELLSSYATSKEQFDELVNKLPLLTLFVPSLPEFSAELWNTEVEIPEVLVFVEGRNKLTSFDSDLIEYTFGNNEAPGSAIVIKENERVVIPSASKGVANGRVLQSKGPYNYQFIDDAFDGSIADETSTDSQGSSANANAREWRSEHLFHRSKTAYDGQRIGIVTYQRDFIYYDVSAYNPAGRTIIPSIHESLTMIKMPKNSQLVADGHLIPHLAEGNLELAITVVSGSTSATKVINLPPDRLWDYGWHTTKSGCNIFGNNCNTTRYYIDWITPLDHKPSTNLSLFAFDINRAGISWKVGVIERDPGTQTIRTYTNNTSFSAGGGNGMINLGTMGGMTNSTAVTTSNTSEDLGEVVMSYTDNVVVQGPLNYSDGSIRYRTQAYSTGTVTLSVEPIPL